MAVAALGHVGPAVTSVAPLRKKLWPQLSGVGNTQSIGLTFDDGPDPASTPLFLAALSELGVKATFFVLGEMLDKAPELGRQMAAEGHEIGIHGWTHRNHLLLSYPQIRDEIRRTKALIQDIAGVTPRFYRPPYGVVTGGDLLAVRTQDVELVLWTSWGKDWQARATGQSVIAELKKGGVVGGATLLLHDSDCTSAPGSWRSSLSALSELSSYCVEQRLDLVPLAEHMK